MIRQTICNNVTLTTLFIVLLSLFLPLHAKESNIQQVNIGNFGLPGVIDLPTAQHFPDGELVIMQQLHKSLARSGISFQALPRVGVSFRYTGHGFNGRKAYGRNNYDRSFDAHISVLNESTYLPAISLGLRDFIGTGWYSSEYIVGTKSIGNVNLTAGLGFGRLSGRHSFPNPFRKLSTNFENRQSIKRSGAGKGGTISAEHWFTGPTSTFYGIQHHISDKITISSEYTPDLMLREWYLDIKSPWNFGISYQLNDYFNLSAQYLHGSQISFTGHVTVNPGRPPLLGGKELAPVPMRLRNADASSVRLNNVKAIRNVLAADKFEIRELNFKDAEVNIIITNTKFRSTAQAMGRIASTLQRFTSDDIKLAKISFTSGGLITGSYRIELEKVTQEQFNPVSKAEIGSYVTAIDVEASLPKENDKSFTWGIGPYITHRLFNPDLPLSLETGVEVQAGYEVTPRLKISGAVRKSILTNLTDNKKGSNSVLPKVHSDWPKYDIEGQKGHIHDLTISYVKNIAPGFYGRAHAGLLEPFFAGFGGELLYKPAQWPIGVGFDIHRVRKRDYDMKFDLLDYETTLATSAFIMMPAVCLILKSTLAATWQATGA